MFKFQMKGGLHSLQHPRIFYVLSCQRIPSHVCQWDFQPQLYRWESSVRLRKFCASARNKGFARYHVKYNSNVSPHCELTRTEDNDSTCTLGPITACAVPVTVTSTHDTLNKRHKYRILNTDLPQILQSNHNESFFKQAQIVKLRQRLLQSPIPCHGRKVPSVSYHCKHPYSTTTEGSITDDSELLAKAKYIISAASEINVMAGSLRPQAVANLLKSFQKQGYNLDLVVDFLSKQPNLLEEQEEVTACTQLLLSHGFSKDVVLDILERLPLSHGLLSVKRLNQSVSSSLKYLRLLGFKEKDLLHMVTSNPGLLVVDSKVCDSVLAQLKELFTSSDALRILKTVPNVVTDPWQETRRKFVYAYFSMGYKQVELLKSQLFQHSLEHVQDRHVFLVRAGLFVFVKEKDDPMLNPNPKLWEVIDTSDQEFAKRFVRISLPEYKTYLLMRELEREAGGEENDEDSHESDTTDEDDTTDESDEDDKTDGENKGYKERGNKKTKNKVNRKH